MGGLGHMGVKIAARDGCRGHRRLAVAVEAGGRPGVRRDEYYATSDPATFKALRNSFDLIVNTVSATLPMAKYLSMLKLDGTMVNVGAPPEPLEVPAFVLMGERRSWAGSGIGGIPETQEMLDFCAEHGIGAAIELIIGDDGPIDAAWDRVVASDVRYRFVIDTSTF